ncbi:hypothetical protein [Parafrankia sp. FMc2]|uniref:hypothetical protein n=1 Tax=Parafrankia sp. FMc2 TaxID=3233196 RepID=UPI0034D5711A
MTQPLPPNFYAGSIIDADDLQGIAGGPGRTPYIPSLTNISIGNGTRAGWYRWLNSGLIKVLAQVVWGSTTTVGGVIEIGLPSGVTLDVTIPQLGLALATDSSPFTRNEGLTIMSATTFSRVIFGSTNNTGANATYPWTWGDNDALIVSGEFHVV